MRPQGWRHGAALCFWGDVPAELPIFVGGVYRREGRRDFSAQELTVLSGLHPFLESAIKMVTDRAAMRTLGDGFAHVVQHRSRGFAILDHHLALEQANVVARELCAAWRDVGPPSRPQTAGSWTLAPVLADACRALRAEWQSTVDLGASPSRTSFHRQLSHPRQRDLTALITMVCPTTDSMAEPSYVLEFERRVHGMALAAVDPSVPLLLKLSAGERAVAMALADGLSNQAIADRLGKKVSAVKFLLHRVYEKSWPPQSSRPCRRPAIGVAPVGPWIRRRTTRRRRDDRRQSPE